MRSLAKQQRIEMDVVCPEIDPKALKASARLRCKENKEDWKDPTIKQAWLRAAESAIRAELMVREFDRLLFEVGDRYRKSYGELRAMRSVELARIMLASKVQSQVMGLRELPEDKEWGMRVEFKIRAKTIH